jgi:hypothetical protein
VLVAGDVRGQRDASRERRLGSERRQKGDRAALGVNVMKTFSLAIFANFRRKKIGDCLKNEK